ncbi:MAG: DoxX family protein [Bacteroidota bacterium]|nr:DoxX family protein [Bacteroidota bacterium]
MMTTSIISQFEFLHTKYVAMVSKLQDVLLLLLRAYWGYDFFQSGMGKLNNLDRTREFFTSLNIPFPAVNAIIVGNIEMIGGILLIAGFGARYFTLPLIAILSVAYATDDHEALMSVFSNPEKFVSATPFLHLLATTIVFSFGAGLFSVDAILEWVRKRNRR